MCELRVGPRRGQRRKSTQEPFWSIYLLTGWLTYWLIDWLIYIDWLIDWSFDWLIDWSFDWLIVRLLIDWLIDCDARGRFGHREPKNPIGWCSFPVFFIVSFALRCTFTPTECKEPKRVMTVLVLTADTVVDFPVWVWSESPRSIHGSARWGFLTRGFFVNRSSGDAVKILRCHEFMMMCTWLLVWVDYPVELLLRTLILLFSPMPIAHPLTHSSTEQKISLVEIDWKNVSKNLKSVRRKRARR